MKPLATLREPLGSVDLKTGKGVRAGVERSDVCSVAPAAVVAEAMVGYVLADAVLEKFGGDSMQELRANVEAYRARVEEMFGGARNRTKEEPE